MLWIGCLTFPSTSTKWIMRKAFILDCLPHGKLRAARYIEEVPGFKDDDCIPRVIEFLVIGGTTHTTQVYRFEGWNTDEELNETDILISSCFADPTDAEKALSVAQERTPREEWVMNRHTVGECDWAEGFEREYY